MFLLPSVLVLRLCSALEGNNLLFSQVAKAFITVKRGTLALSKDAVILRISPNDEEQPDQKVEIERCSADDDTCSKKPRPGDILDESLQIRRKRNGNIQLMKGGNCYRVYVQNQTIEAAECNSDDVLQEFVVIPSLPANTNGKESGGNGGSARDSRVVARKRQREKSPRGGAPAEIIGADGSSSKESKNSRNHRMVGGNREQQRYAGKERQQIESIEQILGPHVMTEKSGVRSEKRPDADTEPSDDEEEDGLAGGEEKKPNPKKSLPEPLQVLKNLMKTVHPDILKRLMSDEEQYESDEENDGKSPLVEEKESGDDESGDEPARKRRKGKQVNKRKKHKPEHRMSSERKGTAGSDKDIADEKRDCVRNPKNNMCYYQLSTNGSLKPVLWPRGIRNTEELCEKRKEWRSTMVCLGRS